MSLINTFIGARSHFSIGESMLTPKSIVAKAASQGAKAVALTDTMTISSMVDFTSAAKKAEIKPIVGCRIRVVEDPTYRKPKKGSGEEEKPNPEFFMNLFVKNDDGMTSLIKLLSKANSEEYFYYYPRVGLSDVLDALSGDSLVATTSDFYSVFHRDDYMTVLSKIKSAHNEAQTFIEIVPINTPLFDRLNARALEAAHVLGIDLIASYPSLYEENQDALTLEVLSAVNSNTQMDAPWRSQQYVKDFSVHGTPARIKKLSDMKARLLKFGMSTPERLDSLGSAFKNLVKFSELCEYEWKKYPVSLPVMATNEYETLVSIVKEGWKSRLTKPTLGFIPDKTEIPKYMERLKYELGVLQSMGFERYFLMVSDLVNWSKREGIMVGPGRGSAGGSLIAYLMGIVDTDPIRFGLLFERFINPDRLDLPDIDLDFMSSRRHEVIDYLIEKYGQEQVAGISNYGTMASASALRDSGRVFGLSADKLTCTRYVPKEHGTPVSLDEAAAAVPEIMAFRNDNPDLWRHATKLEGKMRSLGKHAAGVVVAGEPITNRAVVENRSGSQVVNWDKRTVEDWGLIKMDILGLSTLDTITKALELIERRHKAKIELTELPLDDEATIKAFGEGRTIGIFQFESGGMRKLLKDLASSGNLTFSDIVATTALYRPGPMDAGLMDDYVAIKTGKKSPWYDHPNMKAALEETQSVIIYQEQVMQVARDLAGFTMTEADHLRKAMGKKDKDKMAEMRDKWVEGCEKHSGVDGYLAGSLFDKIEKFAGYGFNKSHAVEYSIISYWAMWLKINYPAEFFAASLSVVGESKLTEIVKDAQKHNVYVVPPDVNESGMDFEIGYDKAREQILLYTPFNRLKGLSDNTAKAILDARNRLLEETTVTGYAPKAKFKSKDEFLITVNKTKVNKRHQEVLDKVGAFAGIEPGLPARHPDRLRDQMELMPGLIVETIKSDRDIVIDKTIKIEVVKLMNEIRSCDKCDLAGGVHPMISLGSTPKFMVVTDNPNWSEEQAVKMFKGKACEYTAKALDAAGLSAKQAYFTAMVKSPKSGRQLTTEQIGACSQYLAREIEILKPPVIVALGSSVVRYFYPEAKGGIMDLAGQIVYMPKLDASVVFGISPLMIHHDPDKQNSLDDTFQKVAELIE